MYIMIMPQVCVLIIWIETKLISFMQLLYSTVKERKSERERERER